MLVVVFAIALQFIVKPSFPPLLAFWESYVVYQRPFLENVDTTPVARQIQNIQVDDKELSLRLKLKKYFHPFILGVQLPHLANTAGPDYVWFNYFVDQAQKIFGTGLLGMRLFSVFSGIVAALFFFLICRRFVSSGPALVATLALVSYPTFIYMQHQYLVWMPSFTVFIIGCWAMFCLREKTSVKAYLLFSSVLLMSFYIYFPMRLGIYICLFIVFLDFLFSKRYFHLKYLIFSIIGVICLIILLDIRNILPLLSGRGFFNMGEANVFHGGLLGNPYWSTYARFILDTLTIGSSSSLSGLLTPAIRNNIVFGVFWDVYPLIHIGLVPVYLIGFIFCFKKKCYEVPLLFLGTTLPYLYSGESITTHRLSAVIFPMYLLCAFGFSLMSQWLGKIKDANKFLPLGYSLGILIIFGINLKMLNNDRNVLNDKMEQIGFLDKAKKYPNALIPIDNLEQRGLMEQTQYIKMVRVIESIYSRSSVKNKQASIVYIDETEWVPISNQPMYSEAYSSSTFLAFYLANRGFQTSYFLWYQPESKERMIKTDSFEEMVFKKVVLNPDKERTVCVATNKWEKNLCEEEWPNSKLIDFAVVKEFLRNNPIPAPHG